MEIGLPPFPIESACSAISELVNECKALEDFSILQIVHLSLTTVPVRCWCGFTRCGALGPYSETQKQALREQMKGVKDWAIDCLKRPERGRREREGRKGTTLRVIELSSTLNRFPTYGDGGLQRFHLGSVKAEEFEVWGIDREEAVCQTTAARG